MSKTKNKVWRFFASIRLALISLIVLATTSIIGTVIKQGKSPSFYAEEFGPDVATLLDLFDLTNMYTSTWFTLLLCLFAVNLIVCSIERLPVVWRMAFLDNLEELPQLEKMGLTHRTGSMLPAEHAVERVQGCMAQAGWNNPRRVGREDGSVLLFVQKGAWTRLGVYVVHLSVLVIMIGALLGTQFGLKAFVFLPEGRVASDVFLQENRRPVPLGFNLQNDRFERTHYQDGSIRQYQADLTIFDPELEAPYQKSVIVNDPLTHKGFTFYLADSAPLEEFYILVRNRSAEIEQAFRVPAERDIPWREGHALLRIEELQRDREGAVLRAKIRFSANGGDEPSEFWIDNKSTASVRQSGMDYALTFRQYYETMLIVTKDPGVPLVFSGCILLVVGLAVSFFLSHRRLWVRITPKGPRESAILLCGTSNKNKLAFEGRFEELGASIDRDPTLASGSGLAPDDPVYRNIQSAKAGRVQERTCWK
jgi:cytochrome c biogenesis protein